MSKKRFSEHFYAYEFDDVEPESQLLLVLEMLRSKTKKPIIINDGPRSIKGHIKIYKDLEKEGNLGDKSWEEAIPWGSRHLPEFGKKLRAVDISCIKESGAKGATRAYYTGDEIYKMLSEIGKEANIHLGIGVGKTFCHVDVDRKKETTWYYSY